MRTIIGITVVVVVCLAGNAYADILAPTLHIPMNGSADDVVQGIPGVYKPDPGLYGLDSGWVPTYPAGNIPSRAGLAGSVILIPADAAALPESNSAASVRAQWTGMTGLGSSTVSVAMWIKTTGSQNGDQKNIFDLREGVNYKFSLKTATTDDQLQLDMGGIGTVAGGFTLNADQWYHVVCTYDGSDIKLYADGSERASTPATGAFVWETDLQAHLAVTRSYPGQFDEIRVYDYALSSGEVSDLYAYTPEPATIAMLALGGLSLIRRKRKC